MEPGCRGSDDVSVLVQEGTGLLNRDGDRFPVDREELGQQCLRAGLAQVQDGRQDPVGGGELEAGARALGAATFGTAPREALLLALLPGPFAMEKPVQSALLQ